MSHISTANLGWIVSGIGALLVIALISGLAFVVRAVFRRPAAGTGSAPSPTEIMDALDAVPVLERPRAAKAYRGMPVRWEVTFESADVTGPFALRLMCSERDTHYPWVWCSVRRGRYPQLRGLLQNAPFRVSGYIRSIGINDIYLRDVRLEFDD